MEVLGPRASAALKDNKLGAVTRIEKELIVRVLLRVYSRQ
jgi:hypothetical protein